MFDSAVGREIVLVTARIVRRVVLWVRKLSIATGMEDIITTLLFQ